MADGIKRACCRHDWIMRRAGGLWVTCRKCPAQVRVDIGETESKWLINPVVTVAGRGGVSIADLDWLCERVLELLHQTEHAGLAPAA